MLIVPGDHFGMDGYLRIGFGDEVGLPARRLEPAAPDAGQPRCRRLLVCDVRSHPDRLRQRRATFRQPARRAARSACPRVRRHNADRRHRDTTAWAGFLGARRRRVATTIPLRRTARRRRDDTASRFSETPSQKSRAAARQRRLVVVETTTLDIERGEPATSHIRAALAGGAHVITANKGPVAFAYGALRRAAERADRRFLFEGAVMDGVPIFNLARETLPAVKIPGFRGVVNSTTNFMLTAMEQGQAVRRRAPGDAGEGYRGGRRVAGRRRVGRGGEDRGARERAAGGAAHAAGVEREGISRETGGSRSQGARGRTAAEAGGARVSRRDGASPPAFRPRSSRATTCWQSSKASRTR